MAFHFPVLQFGGFHWGGFHWGHFGTRAASQMRRGLLAGADRAWKKFRKQLDLLIFEDNEAMLALAQLLAEVLNE